MEFANRLQDILERQEEVILVTLVSHRGSAPQVDGAKMIISQEGLEWGTIGGGKVEEQVKSKSQELLDSEERTLFLTWNLQKDVGMTCGGEVSFYFEKFGKSAFNIAVFGAGHVAQALVPLLAKIDCKIHWIDSRKSWLDKGFECHKIKKILAENPADEVGNLPDGTFIISMTQGHKFDVPILAKVFSSKEKFPYIGCIGSSQKAQAVKSDLFKLGISESDLETLYCPIGLPFGKNIPEEISFSIISQLLAERDRLS